MLKLEDIRPAEGATHTKKRKGRGIAAGHGKKRVQLVCADLLTYRQLGFDCNHVQYKCAVQAVQEYDIVHKNANYALPASLQQLIDCVLKERPIESHEQKQVNRY